MVRRAFASGSVENAHAAHDAGERPTLGPVGDRFEREADRVARAAVSGRRSPGPISPVAVPRTAVDERGRVATPVWRGISLALTHPGRFVPDGIRTRMEQDTGANFNAVRIHADERARKLNNSLSSQAFTVGADIFVRPDRYRPGTPAGDALLAHELTHTVQQSRHGPGPTVVQRFIGFEFETGVAVRDERGKELNYNDPVYAAHQQDHDWQVKADSSNMEFVTDKLSGRKHIREVMKDMVTFVENLQNLLDENRTIKISEVLGGEREPPERQNYTLSYQGMIGASPQVSFGVPLESVAALLKQGTKYEIPIYSPGDPDRWPRGKVTPRRSQRDDSAGIVDATELAERFRERLLAAVGNPQPADAREADRVVGLAALIFHHLNAFYTGRSGGGLEYSKSILPIMHRTDFHSMYLSIDPTWRQYLTPETIADIWWESTDDPAGKLVQIGKLNTHQTGFPVQKGNATVHFGYSLEAWLRSIVDPQNKAGHKSLKEPLRDAARWDDLDNKLRFGSGESASARKVKDLMSRGAARFSSESIGKLGMDTGDPNFPDRRLAVLEFRDLANAAALNYQKWPLFAQEMHTFYEEVTKVRMP